MLERPSLSDAKICACLQSAYGIAAREIAFLPLGNDATAWVYRVPGDPGWFLKVKRGGVYPPSLSVPRWLRDQGIAEVVAPVDTRAGALSQALEDFTLILYPWIEGPTGMEAGLTAAQWVEFGRALRRIHAARLPEELAAQVRRETFQPPWAGMVETLQASIRQGGFHAPVERALAAFWQARGEKIARLAQRCVALGDQLRARPADFVLCHTDIHTANVLVAAGLHIVDWDQPLLAPVERDLMFFFNAVDGRVLADSPEQRAFLGGYGPAAPDPLALAYYQYEWVVQEIGDFGQRILLAPELGAETREAALEGFKKLFQPGDVVDVAEQSGF